MWIPACEECVKLHFTHLVLYIVYSKCKLNRKFDNKKKDNHYIKEMVDNFFLTCLCVSIFKVSRFPNRDSTNVQW